MLMTTTSTVAANLPLPKLMRAKRLPPPAERRAIRDRADLSREDIARDLRAKGIKVTAAAVTFWEKEKSEGGFDPRPTTRIAYRRLLEQILAELDAQAPADERPQK